MLGLGGVSACVDVGGAAAAMDNVAFAGDGLAFVVDGGLIEDHGAELLLGDAIVFHDNASLSARGILMLLLEKEEITDDAAGESLTFQEESVVVFAGDMKAGAVAEDEEVFLAHVFGIMGAKSNERFVGLEDIANGGVLGQVLDDLTVALGLV